MITMMNVLGPPMSPDPVFGVGTDAFLGLLRLIGDPDAAKERLAKIYEAVIDANKQIADAKTAQGELAAARAEHDAQIGKERGEHDRALAEAKKKFDSDCSAAAAEILSQRESAATQAAQAKADATAAADLRADLEQRLAKIRSAAA
jgi:hypothetical protein